MFNNKNNLDERKVESTLKSRKLNYVIINTETRENLEELKEVLEKAKKEGMKKIFILGGGTNQGLV